MLISKMAHSKQEIEGIWADAGEGLEVKVARLNNPKHRDRIRELTLSNTRRHQRAGGVNAKLADKAAKRAIAECVLLDWRNMQEDRDGQEIDVVFSVEKAISLFNDYPKFFDIVCELAEDETLFHEEDMDEAAKN